jgi:hypothetical protein
MNDEQLLRLGEQKLQQTSDAFAEQATSLMNTMLAEGLNEAQAVQIVMSVLVTHATGLAHSAFAQTKEPAFSKAMVHEKVNAVWDALDATEHSPTGEVTADGKVH